jgi:hypothetical protein
VVIVLNTIEGQLVTPMLIGARMRMSALGIFVAIAFGAWLWGRGRGADRHADADRGERLRHPVRRGDLAPSLRREVTA